MKLPSVIALKQLRKLSQSNPNFTRFNVFLRDKFSCQYCGSKNELTFDHLITYDLVGEKLIGIMLLQLVQVVTFKKEEDFFQSSGMMLQTKTLINQQLKIFIKTVKIFLQTFYTKVGWIIYIGMLSLNLN